MQHVRLQAGSEYHSEHQQAVLFDLMSDAGDCTMVIAAFHNDSCCRLHRYLQPPPPPPPAPAGAGSLAFQVNSSLLSPMPIELTITSNMPDVTNRIAIPPCDNRTHCGLVKSCQYTSMDLAVHHDAICLQLHSGAAQMLLYRVTTADPQQICCCNLRVIVAKVRIIGSGYLSDLFGHVSLQTFLHPLR